MTFLKIAAIVLALVILKDQYYLDETTCVLLFVASIVALSVLDKLDAIREAITDQESSGPPCSPDDFHVEADAGNTASEWVKPSPLEEWAKVYNDNKAHRDNADL